MIPQVRSLTPEVSLDRYNVSPSKTYRWDLKTNRIQGYVDGVKALEQSIYKMLNTERFEYLIYPPSYGVELQELIGMDIPYVKADLKRRLEEALTQDDRIQRVENLQFSQGDEKHSLVVIFDVITVEGAINLRKELSI